MALRPIYYDTETTGVKAEKDRIIEIAAFDPVRNLTFVEFVNPGCKIPKEATAIHNITDEMVENSPSFKEVGKKFIEFCEGETVLIAHNNDSFDFHFLKFEFERNNVEMPKWRFLDSLKWARKYRPDLPRHSLQFLREIYNIEANQAHRALDDVIILHQVFSYMIDDLSLDTVYELMNKTQTISHMPFGKHAGTILEKLPTDYVRWLKSSGALDKPENSNLKQALDKLFIQEALALK